MTIHHSLFSVFMPGLPAWTVYTPHSIYHNMYTVDAILRTFRNLVSNLTPHVSCGGPQAAPSSDPQGFPT